MADKTTPGTILLIEDHEDMRDNIAEILELANYRVLTAANGKDGVKLAKEQSPHLIICDIMMPELDGYGVLHLLSRDPETACIPFIFLTAKSEKTDFRKGMSLGADDYLTKPFDDIELLNVVETRIKKSNQLKSAIVHPTESFQSLLNVARGLDELKKLSSNGRARAYKKKQVIYMEDSYPLGIYLLKKGKVKTVQTHDDGKELITGLYNEGDFFGYRALLDNCSYTESAVTLESSELILIPRDDFFLLLHSNRDVSAHFIKLLCNSVADTEKQLLDMAYNSVRRRISNALIQLYDRFNNPKIEKFSMRIPREDLAGLAGTATETVIRTLSDFKSEKLIDTNGGTITFLKPERLRNMMN